MIFFKKSPITIAVIVFIVFDNARANIVDRDDLCMDKLYNPRLPEKNSSPILNCMNFRTRAIQIMTGNPDNTAVFTDYTTGYYKFHLKTFLNSTECALALADWCSLFAKDNNIPECVVELETSGYTGEIQHDYEQARQYCSPTIINENADPINQTVNRTNSFNQTITNSPRNRSRQPSRTSSGSQADINDLSNTAMKNSKMSRTNTLTRSPSNVGDLINNTVNKLFSKTEKSNESISDSTNAPNLIYPIGSNSHRYTFYLCGFTESKNLRDVVVTPRKFCFQSCLDELQNANLYGSAKDNYNIIKSRFKGQIPSNLNVEKGRTWKNFHIVGGYTDRYAAYLITFDAFEGDGLLSLLSGIDWCNWQLGMGQSMPMP